METAVDAGLRVLRQMLLTGSLHLNDLVNLLKYGGN
jgi:hypothetical protein